MELTAGQFHPAYCSTGLHAAVRPGEDCRGVSLMLPLVALQIIHVVIACFGAG
jgi:hypothetical protein